MNFKLVSKNNIGFVVILLLVIILSQQKAFNFIINTYLGRIFLIFLLLVVSYCHKILGIVFVFLVVISFNYKSRYFEGLTTETKENMATSKTKPKETAINLPKTTLNTDNIDPLEPLESTGATEGLSKNLAKRLKSNDFIGTENAIKRGKQSNTIPVNNSQRSSKNAVPVNVKTIFKDNFSKF